MTQPNAKYMGIEGRRGFLSGLTPKLAPRLIVGVALISISLISATAVWRAGSRPTPVLVFARAIDAGARLSTDDLGEVQVATSTSTLEHFVRSVDRESILGMRLVRSVGAGEPVVRSAISPDPPSARVVTLPVAPAGSTPDLAVGDLVDVVASFAAESEDARTVVVAAGVYLVSISSTAGAFAGPTTAQAPPGVGSADGDRVIAAVQVRGPEVVPLVFASQNGVLSLVRSIPGENLAGQETSAFSPYKSEVVAE
jgi:Flp pilus assembly protein CpaB